VTDERPVPAQYDWALKVWEAMRDAATPEQMEGEDAPVLVYQGHLTNLFQQFKVPNPYYSKITTAFKNQGYAVQLRRGGGSAESRWALLKEPDPESFREAATRNRVRQGKVGQLEQRVNDLQKLAISSVERLERVTLRLQERVEALEQKGI